jgi:hypothetical protein
MSVDNNAEFFNDTYFKLYLNILPIVTPKCLNIILFFGMNMIISGLKILYRRGLFLISTFYIVISPDEGRNCQPKHVARVKTNRY